MIGGANRDFSLHQAFLLRLWSEDIDFIVNHMYLSPDERRKLMSWGVNVFDDIVDRVDSGQEMIGDSIIVRNSYEIIGEYDSVFVGPVFTPNDFLLRRVGCVIENDWIKVDIDGKTSKEGLWAAGNCVSSTDQIANSISAGVRTAISMNHYLLYKEVDSL